METALPRFVHQGEVFAGRELRYNPCHDLIFPSVIATRGCIPHALGDYYLYYAPHDAPGGICLAYANSPEGPWIEYPENPIITRTWKSHYEVSHISSPHALWNGPMEKLCLYFHGENDTTRLATSRDGIHFDYEGVAVHTGMYDRISEASYARVFPCDPASSRGRYLMVFMGNNDGTRRIYSAWSNDGRTFEAEKKPLINPPPGTEVTQVGAPWYLPHEGRNIILFHGDIVPPNWNELTTDIYAADVGPDFTQENHLGIFYRRQEVSAENLRVSDPCILEAGGVRYLFASAGPRLRQTLVIARK